MSNAQTDSKDYFGTAIVGRQILHCLSVMPGRMKPGALILKAHVRYRKTLPVRLGDSLLVAAVVAQQPWVLFTPAPPTCSSWTNPYMQPYLFIVFAVRL